LQLLRWFFLRIGEFNGIGKKVQNYSFNLVNVHSGYNFLFKGVKFQRQTFLLHVGDYGACYVFHQIYDIAIYHVGFDISGINPADIQNIVYKS